MGSATCVCRHLCTGRSHIPFPSDTHQSKHPAYTSAAPVAAVMARKCNRLSSCSLKRHCKTQWSCTSPGLGACICTQAPPPLLSESLSARILFCFRLPTPPHRIFLRPCTCRCGSCRLCMRSLACLCMCSLACLCTGCLRIYCCRLALRTERRRCCRTCIPLCPPKSKLSLPGLDHQPAPRSPFGWPICTWQLGSTRLPNSQPLSQRGCQARRSVTMPPLATRTPQP